MPASAVVEAAKITIAVNIDTTILCFISILLKNGWGNLLATVATLSLLGVSDKTRPVYTRLRKKPMVTVVSIFALQRIGRFSPRTKYAYPHKPASKADRVICSTIRKSQVNPPKKGKIRSGTTTQDYIPVTPVSDIAPNEHEEKWEMVALFFLPLHSAGQTTDCNV